MTTGDKQATLRMAQQELEDLYLGVPDDSVDLTFRDFASAPPSLPAAAAATASSSNLPALPHGGGAVADERNSGMKATDLLTRSSTNIFTYRPLEDRCEDGGRGGLLQLPSPPAPPPGIRSHGNHPGSASAQGAAAVGTSMYTAAQGDRRSRRMRSGRNNVADSNYRQRPGIPHSNICALCNKYIYFFRHRCLVCGRVYCRGCVGAGMGDMAEGRKCIDCQGQRFSHRYIHRAGDAATGCCLCFFWGYYPSAKAVTAQELIWAEKGPAPRRRQRHHPAAGSSSSYAASGDSYSANTIASASMSMTINSDSSMTLMKMNGRAGNSTGGVLPASASSSFVASYAPNPHALPL